jgi:hypothetical protein
MEKVIYSDNCGEGLILYNDEKINIKPLLVKIANEIIHPGEKTTMSGYFKEPLLYCGLYRKALVFYIGTEQNLFESIHYYQIVHKISENRLFSMFRFDSGRDFNFINGIWK